MPDILWQATSKFGKLIRLTDKIWSEKILQEHPEFSLRPEYVDALRRTIEQPEYIVQGSGSRNYLLYAGVRLRLEARNFCAWYIVNITMKDL